MSGRKIHSDISGLLGGTAPLITAILLACVMPALAGEACHPVLAISDVRFTAMQPPTLERTWSATVSADAARCAAAPTGTFEIVFVRASENAPDLEFRQRFTWRAPSVEVRVTFAADEAVLSYRIGDVTSCLCSG